MAASNTLSSGETVVQPHRVQVREGETATFHCDVIDNLEPIHNYSWDTTPPLPNGRVEFDNNEKTIHILNMRASENNTKVVCSAHAASGSHSAMGIVSLLRSERDNDDDDDDDGDDGDGGGGGGRTPPEQRTTPSVSLSSKPPNERIATTRVTGSTLGGKLLTESMSGRDGPNEVQFSPAATGAIISVIGLIVIAILVVIIRRLRQSRDSHNHKSESLNSSINRVHNRSFNNGYEEAPTIDSRASQSHYSAAVPHNKHYIPKYQKPNKHMMNKSLPSLYAVNIDDDEYEFMKPGSSTRGEYDHLARSNPESIHKLGIPTLSSDTLDYASLTKEPQRHKLGNSHYENDELVSENPPSFELCDEQLALKYASLNHHGGPSAPPETPRSQTSYAKIRGILRILRTQNSTRVNIEPC